MAILITRIIAKRTQFSKAHRRYWNLWSEAHASPVPVFEDELEEAHWLEEEAKKLRDFMFRMPEGQEKTLDAPAVIEVAQDDKYYQVARVVKGPPVSLEEQDWIDEIASRIRQQVAELQSVQQARIDALESELADKQRRIDELAAMIQAQQARITLLENEADQATAEPAASKPESIADLDVLTVDVHPVESVTEDEKDGAWSAAKLFDPVDTAVPDEDVDGLPIPPRPPVDEIGTLPSEIRTERLMHPDGAVLCYETNMDLTPDREYLKVLSAFIEACKNGQYLDYILAGFSKLQVYRLFRTGMLERSVETFDKMRPSVAGELWHRRHTAPQTEAPRQEIVIDLSEVEQIRKESTRIRDILLEDDADSEQDEQAQEDSFADGETDDEAVADIPNELTDHTELVNIIGAGQSDKAHLIAVMMRNDWACALGDLEAAFNGEFVNVIIDDINERAYEEIGDSLIVEEDGRWVIDEDCRDGIEHILNHPDYRRQIADSLPKEKPLDEPAASADSWVAFAEQLQQYQRETVAVILSGIYVESSLNAIAMREYISVDDIIYQINELADEYLGDGLIGNDGFLTPTIDKEAQQKLKYVLWGINREMNEDEDDEENT